MFSLCDLIHANVFSLTSLFCLSSTMQVIIESEAFLQLWYTCTFVRAPRRKSEESKSIYKSYIG